MGTLENFQTCRYLLRRYVVESEGVEGPQIEDLDLDLVHRQLAAPGGLI